MGADKDEYAGQEEEEEDEDDEEAEGFDEEGGDGGEEDEDEEEEDARPKKRGRASQFIDDAAEEDEAEDEDDEDEEEGGGGGGGEKRAKKGGGGYRRSAFIDDVAQVASDDEEEEEEEEDGFIDRESEQVEDVGRPSHHHRRMMSQEDKMNEMSEEEYARMLEERYNRVSEGAVLDEMEATDVEQQALLPSVRDTKLWMIRCRAGFERDAVLSIMQKFANLSMQGDASSMQISAAIALDSLKEHIYIEAMKEQHVQEACKGNRLLSAYKVTLVPIKEMTGVLTVHNKVEELNTGTWVRIKSGLHKGDLAQVVGMDTVKARALLKFVPRLDLQALEHKQNGETVTKKRFRPPPKFFSLTEAKEAGVKMLEVYNRTTGERCYSVDGQPFLQFAGGYQLRSLPLKSLEMKGVVPTLDELQKFQRTGEEEGGSSYGGSSQAPFGLAPSLANQTRSRLLKGDPVEVIEGDLKGIKGRVEKVEEDEVTFRPIHSELKEALVVKANQLRKFFKTGDHVKVIAGQFNGETGMVVKVDGQVAIVIADTSRDHVKVFCRDLISSSEVTSGITQLGDYQLHDLVQLDQTMAGVIVKVDAGGFVVLKAVPDRPEAVPVKLPEIMRKLTKRNASAQDIDGRAISTTDPVRVMGGLYKGKQGLAEHIYRGMVFVLDRDHLENGGFFCVRSKLCRALKGHQSGGSDFGKPPNRPMDGPGRGRGPLASPSHFLNSPRNAPGSPARPGFGRGAPGQFGGGGRFGNRREDMLVGRIIKIRSGPYKGYRGRVMEATDTNARIELESTMRVVTVRRDQLPDGGGMQGSGGGGGGATPGGRGMAHYTPNTYRDSSYNQSNNNRIGMETPMHPSRTPMHSGYGSRSDPTATPIHEGMRTPMRDSAWNPNVPTTPLRTDSYEDNNVATWALNPPRTEYTPYTPAFSPPDAAASPPDHSGHPQTADTPGGSVYDVDTPAGTGGQQGYGAAYSENEDARTPYDVGTPGSLLAGTPGLASTPGTAPSPYPPAPLTASSPFIPSTPADLPMTPGDQFGAGEGGSLFLPGILVNVPRPGAPSESITVVIRELLQDGSCRVGVMNAPEEELFVVASRNIEAILPKKNDKVLILQGESRGARGKLIGTDAGDGIVKMDADSDVKILELSALGKLAPS